MLRRILCIVFLLSANCLPVQSQDQANREVTLRVGFAPTGVRTIPGIPEGAEVTFNTRGEGTIVFTPIIGEDSEVVVTFSDLDGNPMGEVTLQQTDECEVIETGVFRFEVGRD